jgi:hypothetical protein
MSVDEANDGVGEKMANEKKRVLATFGMFSRTLQLVSDTSEGISGSACLADSVHGTVFETLKDQDLDC